MKFFTQTLACIAILVFGFLLGVRYQARVESLDEMHTLVKVQRAKLDDLRADADRIRTVVMVREYLDESRIRLPRSTVNEISGSIWKASARYNVPPEMILAVIRVESAFDINAQSDKGAVGLMQILPSTAHEIAQELRMDWPGEELLRDPGANIEMGTYYLTKMVSQFNDLSIALAAYNHGPGRIAELAAAREDLPMEYSEKVMGAYTP